MNVYKYGHAGMINYLTADPVSAAVFVLFCFVLFCFFFCFFFCFRFLVELLTTVAT